MCNGARRVGRYADHVDRVAIAFTIDNAPLHIVGHARIALEVEKCALSGEVRVLFIHDARAAATIAPSALNNFRKAHAGAL